MLNLYEYSLVLLILVSQNNKLGLELSAKQENMK